MIEQPTTDMTEDEKWYYQFGDCVTAALETCSAKRWVATGCEWNEDTLIPRAVRTADIVETAAIKIEARDPGAVHEVFASQALVLDEIFTQFTGMAAKDPESFKTSMAVALKAQSQCRHTLKALLAMNDPRELRAKPSAGRGVPATAANDDLKNVCGQTIENEKFPA